jgi:hypothetical protein
MITKNLDQAKDGILRESVVALQRASRLARDTAIQTGTHLVLVIDGKLVRVSADELRSQTSGTKS